ncbi:MAG: family 43 glycosylhydrolase [Clostridiales bacterium]|nr:family 43 glycosylhydrolase [Clostridiales bacterium]
MIGDYSGPYSVVYDRPETDWTLDRLAFMTDIDEETELHVKGNAEVTWKTDNKTVATVDKNGVVKAIRKGDAKITATAADGSSSNCIVSVGYEGQNPCLPPTWGLLIADPEPLEFDGVLYVYGSRDNPNGINTEGVTQWCSDTYYAICTEDLIHWTVKGISFRLTDIPEKDRGNAVALWAPDLYHSVKDGKYYLTGCTNDPGSGIFVAVSDIPEGPFKYVGRITQNSNKALITQIDPGALVDDDGSVYIVTPGFYVGLLDEDTLNVQPYKSVSRYMSKDYFAFEGPSLRKKGDLYYYIYIQDITKTQSSIPTRMAYMTSTDPLGPYTYQGLIITNYDYLNSGNIHGSFVEFKGQTYVFYHMSYCGLRLTRSLHITPITFLDDGTIQEALPTSSGAKGSFKKGEVIQAASAIVYSGGRDDIRITPRYDEDKDNKNIWRFTDYPYVYFNEADQSLGYRYVDGTDVSKITIKVQTQGSDAKLSCKMGDTVVAELTLPDTKGEWQTVTADLSGSGSSQEEFTLSLDKMPDKGKQVNVDSFWFD